MYHMSRQSRQRLHAWREALKTQVYVPIAPAVFSGFLTMDRLTLAQAEAQPRLPFPPGTAWGKCWEYGWFFADISLPAACDGQRVVLMTGLGGEQLVYLNGRAIGSIDREHPYVTLSTRAQGGEVCRIAVESYAGHGARLENLGPCPPEREPLPPVPAAQCKVQPGGAMLWNEDAYQLLLDVEALARLLEVLPDRGLRAMRVAEGLEAFTRIADFELPPDQRSASFRAAREALAPLLQCRNGSTAPLMLLLGQSHIDLGWLWPVEETYHKASRTFANQLTLMAEYPEYRFLACEPALLEMLQAHSPALWDELQAAFRRGQIVADGAFYVECDTNLPSGESLVRQLMWGKRWFREHFGVDSRVAWQPDTFGFSGALPQLLQGFGIPYFATQKLLRADPEYPRFPYQNFLWEGIDGTTVQSLSFFKNNAPLEPASFHRRWEEDRAQSDHIDTLLYPFGYGDGGGGATRDFVEMARRLADLEGVPRSRYGSLQEYFELSAASARGNRWVGELYLQWHRGTYIAQRRAKALMRRLEEAIHDAELLVSFLPPDQAEAYAPALREAWKTLLFHQFHDIAAGVGLARVHREQTEAVQDQWTRMTGLRESLCREVFGLASADGQYTLFNPLPWPVKGFARLPDGRTVYRQIPAGGVAPAENEGVPQDVSAWTEGASIFLQNACLRAEVAADGRILSLTDRASGLEFVQAGGALNDWRLYKDVESVYDAWELGSAVTEFPCEGAFVSSAHLTLNTPACAEITVTHAFSQSTATQVIRLEAGARRLEFENQIDWRERHKLLKVHFFSNVLCRDALHEIQFGLIRRPAHRSDAAAAAQYEVCQHRYSALCDEGRGLALLNDGSYGISCDRGEMALTLLRAPLVPDPTCDQGGHSLCFALMPFVGPFANSGVIQAGYEFNQPPVVIPGACSPRTGIRAEQAIVETIKPAEDGRGMILRLYEPVGRTCQARIFLPFPGALSECGLQENEDTPLGTGQQFTLPFRPFQIRTFRLLPAAQAAPSPA